MHHSSLDEFLSTSPALLLVLLMTLHAADRAHLVASRSLLLLVAAVVIGLVFVFYVSGTHLVLRTVADSLRSSPYKITTTEGIVDFALRLQVIAAERFVQVLILASGVYLFLQTFCIPGTVVLNVAIGSLMGVGKGVPLCTVLGTLGAASCYTLSSYFGNRLVEKADLVLMKSRGLPKLRSQVVKYRHDLFVYMLFLRLTPVLPNWLVNLASPVVGVPIREFAAATFLGILPQTYLAVRFGSLVHAVAAAGGVRGTRIVTIWDTLLLCVIAVTAVGIAKLRRRFQQQQTETPMKEGQSTL